MRVGIHIPDLIARRINNLECCCKVPTVFGGVGIDQPLTHIHESLVELAGMLLYGLGGLKVNDRLLQDRLIATQFKLADAGLCPLPERVDVQVILFLLVGEHHRLTE